MNNKIIITALMCIFLVLPINASSLEFVGECIDSNRLEITINYAFDSVNYNLTQSPITCPHGCVEGFDQYGDDCAPSSRQENVSNHGIAIAFSIMLSIISIVFVYISFNVSEKNSILAWYFLPFSMIIMVVNIFVLASYTVDVGIQNIMYSTGFTIIITIVFMFFYFMIFFITRGFERLTNKERDRYGDKMGA